MQTATTRNQESGQAAVLAAMLCFLLAVMIVMTTNLGKITTQKIAMQNAVDLAAYSGAATQAGYMNKMRKENNDVWDEIDKARQKLETSDPLNPIPFFNDVSANGCQCSAKAQGKLAAPMADAFIALTKASVAIKVAKIDITNMDGSGKALKAAKDAANANYKGAGDKLTAYQNTSGPMMKITEKTVDLSYRGFCYTCPCGTAPCTPIPSRLSNGDTVKSWKWKDDSGDVVFAAKIENAVPTDALSDMGGYFESKSCVRGSPKNGRCPLNVYAVAMPYYGKLGTKYGGKGQWEMNETDWNDPNPMNVDKSQPLQVHKVVKGQHYRDYKVRFIGIFDQQGNFTQMAGGGQLKSKVGGQDSQKMRH